MSSTGWLTLAQALQQLIQAATPVTQTEQVRLTDCLGRICAQDIVAPVSVPPQDVSAMDGYAIGLPVSAGQSYQVTHTILAGSDVSGLSLAAGEAARIMTGASILAGASAVVMQENTERDGDTVVITQAAREHENIRAAGNDITAGQTVISAGTRLSASHLMLLASLGMADCTVLRQLKVGLIATGDEIMPAGTPLQPGQIYNSNTVGVQALLAPLNVDVHDFGIARDDKQSLTNTLLEASSQVDVLISTGGVSVGEADFVKQVLDEHGEVGFWKVAIKPGKPFAFGQLGQCLFCGVPGNPVSAFVTTQQLVMPLIESMQGLSAATRPLTIKAALNGQLKRRAGRQEFLRARLWQADNGDWQVTLLAKQSSGVMTTVTQANAYIIADETCTALNDGDTVTVQPFHTRDHWSC
ncbi:molybdopterin molybdotransferase MoeA [Salinimonas lutimaris]|uniref:molybdopterin molybdotransferase MoeA n=1 Tax=Salinimonas lutimaris TaxID=914153 RepID=UPI0010C01EDD|nr:gephyrin-like molybdotransferase Glp [Salinimonas lutimaris]